MSWNAQPAQPDQQAAERTTLAMLLRLLDRGVPISLDPFVEMLQQGRAPLDVLLLLNSVLAEQFARRDAFIHQLQSSLAMQQSRYEFLEQENQRLLAAPLYQQRQSAIDQLVHAQNELTEMTHTAEQAEKALAKSQSTLQAERKARQQEVAQLQSVIAKQNRIISQQQLRLNALLGNTPGAETTGGKSK